MGTYADNWVKMKCTEPRRATEGRRPLWLW